MTTRCILVRLDERHANEAEDAEVDNSEDIANEELDNFTSNCRSRDLMCVNQLADGGDRFNDAPPDRDIRSTDESKGKEQDTNNKFHCD